MGSACPYRSRVDSARAHVCARMYAYTYERFYKYQFRRSIQHRRRSPAVTVPAHRPSLLLGSQVRTHPPSPRLASPLLLLLLLGRFLILLTILLIQYMTFALFLLVFLTFYIIYIYIIYIILH